MSLSSQTTSLAPCPANRSPVVSSPVVSSSAVPKSLSPSVPAGLTSFVRQWWPVGLFSVLWLDLIRQLSYQWSNSEQYAYGWFVPLLALGLFLRKWSTRPRDRSQYGVELLKPIAAERANPPCRP